MTKQAREKSRTQSGVTVPLGAARRGRRALQELLAEVAPVVELVGVFGPAVADVGAVVHVGNQDVFGAGVHLGLGLLHGVADTDDDENDAGGAGDEPLAVDFFHVFDVNAFHVGLFEDDGVVLGEGFESGVVIERKRRDDDSNADLKAAASAPFGLDAGGKFP